MMATDDGKVIAGIDTHKDTHHVAVIDAKGQPLADAQFPTSGTGYRRIIAFITSLGLAGRVGVEGTGSYGAELTRTLVAAGFEVIEVDRPNRQDRRKRGKSDPIDAYQAAQAVLTSRAKAVPKARNGAVEAMRMLRTERSSAMKARNIAIVQAKALLITSPDRVRARYRDLTGGRLMQALARLRPTGQFGTPLNAAHVTLKRLGIRYQTLEREISQIDAELDQLVTMQAPALRDLPGVGTEVASQLLVTVGDNPQRVTTEAQFAALAGVAPQPASSGQTTRHRLSLGGDRQANWAVHRVVLSRMTFDPRTQAYVQRRTQEGLSKKEIMRCLKRYVARELYHQITDPKPAPDGQRLRTLRQKKKISLQQAADHHRVWPITLSRLERGLARNDELYHRYEEWLQHP